MIASLVDVARNTTGNGSETGELLRANPGGGLTPAVTRNSPAWVRCFVDPVGVRHGLISVC
jgi:hypothetical protein